MVLLRTLILVALLISCGSPYKITDVEEPKFDFNKSMQDTLTVRTDGLYALYDTSTMPCGEKVNEHFTIFSPLNIINSQNASWNNKGGSYTFKKLTIDAYQHPMNLKLIGNYFIFKDTIFAKLPILLSKRGQVQAIFMANFQGTIKNKDTILDWHMIPPYPNANPKYNNDFKFLKTPHLLYFIESKQLLGLDSFYQQRIKQAAQNEKK